MHHRFIIALVLSIACAACSSQREQAAPASPAASTSAATRMDDSKPLYFYDLLQRADFASAFAALSGANALPAWTRQGGTSTPAQHLELHGRPQLLAAACKPHDCPSERILVLYDVDSHAMSGLFARRKAGASNDIDSNDPANDDQTWLGSPDEDAKRLLQKKLYSPE